MFCSRELAKKALHRVDQIKKAKRRKVLSATMLSTAICISAAWLLALAAPIQAETLISEPEPPTVYIADPGVPLASPTAILTECTNECEPYEECEYCHRE